MTDPANQTSTHHEAALPDGHRLILLPGLGADVRLFLPQLKAFEHASTPGWIDPIDRDNEPLRLYAARFAEHLAQQNKFDAPYSIVGFSFGGQVALEVARYLARTQSQRGHRLPSAVVLLASHRRSATIDRRFRRNVRTGNRMPAFLATLILGRLAGRFAKLNGLDEKHAQILRDIAADIDLPFLKWGGRATVSWTFTDDDEAAITDAGTLIRRMHGGRDTVIPLDRARTDLVLEDRPHLLTWTDDEAVNRFIASAVRTAVGA